MRHSASPATPLFSDAGAGTLHLLGYLLAAAVLMVADFRGGYLAQFRHRASAINEPLFALAALPARAARGVLDAATSQSALIRERDGYRSELLLARAQLARLDDVQRENRQLRELLDSTGGLGMRVRLAMLADFDLDPFRHRAVLDVGELDGVAVGTALIDAGGVYGQVVRLSPRHATAMLISDPAHAVPVQVQRSGVRTIAYGTGDIDRLHIPNIPQSADVREGDLLVTSGLGGRFPAGLRVGRINALRSDDTRLFLVAEAEPSAQLGRGRELLLVWTEPLADSDEVGPPRALMSAPPAPESEPTP